MNFVGIIRILSLIIQPLIFIIQAIPSLCKAVAFVYKAWKNRKQVIKPNEENTL
jgi:hypothetical protein